MNKWIDKIAAVQYAAIDKARDPRAFEIATQPPSGCDLSGFERTRQCLLVTFPRSGQPMPSLVNFGIADAKLYFRTDANTGKVKRIRRESRVIVAPCGLRGRPLGPGVSAIARILAEPDTPRADEIIASTWSPGMHLLERLLDKASRQWHIPMTYVCQRRAHP